MEHLPDPAASPSHRSTGSRVSAADPEPVVIRVDDHLLVTDLFGDPSSPPVVLLHGIPGWRGTWRPVARLLAARHRVVVPDLLGFGESGPAPARFHAADQAALVIALVQKLGLRRVHLAGFDFGGPTAVMVCRQAPDLVATLTLAATNLLPDTAIPPPLQLVRPPLVGDVFARLLFGRPGLMLLWFAAASPRGRVAVGSGRITGPGVAAAFSNSLRERGKVVLSKL